MRSYGHDQPIETAVEAEAPTFGEAVNDAAVRLGVSTADLAIEILDPGAGEGSSTGFRPVKIRARRRAAHTAPDGARPKPPGDRRSYERGGYDRGGHGSREVTYRRPEPVHYGPPPAPMDPSKITPEILETVRGLADGIRDSMEFEGTVTAEKTSHGIRIGIDAGENDQFLIGKDGETLSAFQHLLGRMVRAKMPDEAPPRIEVDVAGYRDRQIEKLRELARELMQEAKETGAEVTTEPLPASERRIVHLEVAEDKEMETVTIGDGYYKRVVVRRATGEPK
ncbi:MAG TPA: R3H domain-containing nucleic acid-binding protein [Candidatus Eisenbacteria bacterium]|jgi:spoIIIJ-associated protein|nr:R3H domain-containing nucleic acid-binding protein [Candidatus Eisenbacteria bacterium]